MFVYRATIEGSEPYAAPCLYWQEHFTNHRAAETALKNAMNARNLDYEQDENMDGDTTYVHYLERIEVKED